MPRVPDMPCAECGQMMWRSRTSLAEGLARCQPCRRKSWRCGSLIAYNKGHCRCDLCKEAKASAIREYVARRREAGKPVEYHRKQVDQACAQCGVVGIRLGSTFCSRACLGMSQRTTGRPPRRTTWISRAKRLALYERDSWTCQICLEPVDRDVTRGDWAPSLDHIVPRSRGGSDDLENLRVAHLWCNSVRGDLSRYTDEDLRVPSVAA